MKEVSVFASVDLDDLESDFIEHFCDNNCLKNKVTISKIQTNFGTNKKNR